MPLLEVKNLGINFGGLRAVNKFDLDIEAGEIVGVIGPNGAGKTTVFNMLSGYYRPTDGTVAFKGKLMNGLRPFQVAQRGIARTFQNIRLFPQISVLDNVRIGFHPRAGYSLLDSILRTPRFKAREAELTEQAPEPPGRLRAWRTRRRSRPAAFPTAPSDGWRSPGRWRCSRTCCCWTSRRRA